MILTLRMQKDVRFNWLLLGLLLFYGVICCTQLSQYLNWTSFNFIIGALGIPFILKSDAGARSPKSYAVLTVVCCILYVLLPVKTALYFAIISAMIFLYAARGGRSSFVIWMTLALMSPVAKFFADSFSFPIRLRLTALAGSILQITRNSVQVEGNMINLNGADFSVDPACMGMNMLVSSLLCALLILALQQKQQRKQLAFGWILLVLGSAIMLNIVSNLLRIILLVEFRIMPEHVLHELVGIICLLVYVLLPMNFFMQWLVRKEGSPWSSSSGQIGASPAVHHGFLAILISIAVLLVPTVNGPRNVSPPQMAGFTGASLKDGVVKLSSAQSLVYLKDQKGFYDSEHNPMLCWTGEGYLFKQVSEQKIAGIPVIAGTLTKGKTILYTAWWYSNGSFVTNQGFEWRMKALKSRTKFSIVNVTTTDQASLEKEVALLTRNGQLNKWLARSGR